MMNKETFPIQTPENQIAQLPTMDLREAYTMDQIDPMVTTAVADVDQQPGSHRSARIAAVASVCALAVAASGNINPATAVTSSSDGERSRFEPGCKTVPASSKPKARVYNDRRAETAGDRSSTYYTNLLNVDVANKTMNVHVTTALPKAGGGRRFKSDETKVIGCHSRGALFIQNVRSAGTTVVRGQVYTIKATARYHGKQVELFRKNYPLRGVGSKAKFEDFDKRSWTLLDQRAEMYK